MTLEVKNAKELAKVLRKWVEEDSIYNYLYENKSEGDASKEAFVVENKMTKNQVKVAILENPLQILILLDMAFLEQHQIVYETFSTFDSFMYHQNIRVNILHFDVYTLFQKNDLNQIVGILFQRQFYPDDLTRNKFFDYLSEMVRAQLTVEEILYLDPALSNRKKMDD